MSQRGSALSGALLFDFTGCHFLSILFSFLLLFFSRSFPPLPFLPSLIPKAEWQPFIPHQTHFMTAAALHSCWMVCLKDFLTRPWIRLLASHSLFLSAWLDSDADIKWTLIQSPSHPIRLLVYRSVLQVKQQRQPQTSDYAFSLPTQRGHRDVQQLIRAHLFFSIHQTGNISSSPKRPLGGKNPTVTWETTVREKSSRVF